MKRFIYRILWQWSYRLYNWLEDRRPGEGGEPMTLWEFLVYYPGEAAAWFAPLLALAFYAIYQLGRRRR